MRLNWVLKSILDQFLSPNKTEIRRQSALNTQRKCLFIGDISCCHARQVALRDDVNYLLVLSASFKIRINKKGFVYRVCHWWPFSQNRLLYILTTNGAGCVKFDRVNLKEVFTSSQRPFSFHSQLIEIAFRYKQSGTSKFESQSMCQQHNIFQNGDEPYMGRHSINTFILAEKVWKLIHLTFRHHHHNSCKQNGQKDGFGV